MRYLALGGKRRSVQRFKHCRLEPVVGIQKRQEPPARQGYAVVARRRKPLREFVVHNAIGRFLRKALVKPCGRPVIGAVVNDDDFKHNGRFVARWSANNRSKNGSALRVGTMTLISTSPSHAAPSRRSSFSENGSYCTRSTVRPLQPCYTFKPWIRNSNNTAAASPWSPWAWKLGDETRGYTRFRFLSELLVSQGFDVDLIAARSSTGKRRSAIRRRRATRAFPTTSCSSTAGLHAQP